MGTYHYVEPLFYVLPLLLPAATDKEDAKLLDHDGTSHSLLHLMLPLHAVYASRGNCSSDVHMQTHF